MQIHGFPNGYVVKTDDGATSMFKSLDEALEFVKHGSHDQSVHGKRGGGGGSAAPTVSAGNSSGGSSGGIGGLTPPTHFQDGSPIPKNLPNSTSHPLGNMKAASRPVYRAGLAQHPNPEARALADAMAPRNIQEARLNIAIFRNKYAGKNPATHDAINGFKARWGEHPEKTKRTMAQLQQEAATAPKYGLPPNFTGALTGPNGSNF